jgi:transposase
MAKKYRIKLTEEERAGLEKVISTRSKKSQQVKRAYALLAADEQGDKGWKDQQIKQSYGLSIASIERLRERAVMEGIEIALNGKKREVFKEKLFTGEVEAKLIALRCSECPQGYQRWTLQLLADQMVSLGYVEQISDESVRQLLKKMKLSLGRSKVG